MRRVLCLAALAISLGLGAQAQRFDFTVGAGTVAKSPPVIGKFWPSLSATFMPFSHLGVGANFAWRTSDAGPFITGANFLDLNLIYRPLPSARVIPELQAGWGTEILHEQQPRVLFTNFDNCLHLGFDLKIPLVRRFFLRPEYHLYFVRLNTASRFALSLGYSF